MIGRIVWLVLLCYLRGTAAEDKIKVLRSILSLSEDGQSISGAKLLYDGKNVSGLVDVTFCIRFNYKMLGGHEGRSRLITVEDWRVDANESDFQFLNFGAEYPYSFYSFGHPRARDSFKSFVLKDPETDDFEIWETNKWTHVCLSYQRSKGSHMRVVKDGQILNLDYCDPGLVSVEIPADFLNKVYLGRCSFDYKATCSGPEGQITDFNVWDRALTRQEMKDWTTCNSTLKGNLVDWTTASFDLVNMTSEYSSVESICVPPRPGDVLFPEPRPFCAHRDICHKMRGRPSVVRDQQTQTKLIREMSGHEQCARGRGGQGGGRFWSGWWDKAKEGQFSDSLDTSKQMSSASTLDFAPWNYGEPDGNTLENCVVVLADKDAWSDVSCKEMACSFCELESAPNLKIRGLCLDSTFDTKYSWTRAQGNNNRHSFRGLSDSELSWDADKEHWRLRSYSNPDVYATVNTSEYPLGTYTWDVYGDPCYAEWHVQVSLNMNACNDSEFNCMDGHCVGIEKRCDGKVDCPDQSDEIGCEILTTDASYLKDVPPPPEPEQDLAEVLIHVDVLAILEISEVDNIIALQMGVQLTWKDERLTMLNLKEDKDLNTLTTDFREKIWMPQIVFYNTRAKLESLNDDKAFATIRRNSTYNMSPRNTLTNAYIFRGSKNPVTVSRVYSMELLCDFNMNVYPFDTQRCSIIFIMKGNTGKFVKLKMEQMEYLGPIDLTQYFVKETLMIEYEVLPGVSAIKVDLIFGRRILSHMMTTYLPTILICVVSFATNYFKSFFFEAIVTVNLTSLLVLTTLFISVSDSLPKTAYLKLIDIWLIFMLFIPFAEVLLHTFIDTLRQEEDREVNHHGVAVKMDGSPMDEDDVDYYSHPLAMLDPLAYDPRLAGLFGREDALKPPAALTKSLNSDTGKPDGIKVAFDKPRTATGKLRTASGNKIINVKAAPGSADVRQGKDGANGANGATRNTNLIHRDEEMEVEARKQFYENTEVSNERQMMIAQKILSKGLPFLFITFVVSYFAIGMSYYNRGIKDI